MANKFETKWAALLTGFPGVPTDFLASVSEEAINEYLKNHFQFDNGLYRVVVEQPFDIETLSGSLVATIEARSPLAIDFKPFTSSRALSVRKPYIGKMFGSDQNWHHLSAKNHRFGAVRKLQPPRISLHDQEDEPDVRVTCEMLHVKLEWPKLSFPDETWTWEADFMILAEANVGLKEIEGVSYLELQPTRIRLSLPTDATGTLPTDYGKIKRSDLLKGEIPAGAILRPANVVTEEDEKFAELVVIVANMLTSEYAPTLVQNVKIPVLQISDKQVYPVFLDVSDNLATVGLSLDKAQLAEDVSYQFDTLNAQFMSFMQQDIDNAGGLDAILYSDVRKKSLRPEKQVREQFPLTQRFIADLEKQNAVQPKAKKMGDKALVGEPAAEGMGGGINGYFIQSLLELVMPAPVNDCASSHLAKLLKGEVCWGISVGDPVASISGTSITGGVSVDLGGSIKACVGDGCDHWACTTLALSLDGDPKVTLEMSTGEQGVVLQAKFDFSKLRLHTNLPTPFDQIISALGNLVIQALTAIINIVLSLIKITIILPEIEIPDQHTRLVLSDYTPFPFVREDTSLSAQRNTFLGYSVTVSAKDGGE